MVEYVKQLTKPLFSVLADSSSPSLAVRCTLPVVHVEDVKEHNTTFTWMCC